MAYLENNVGYNPSTPQINKSKVSGNLEALDAQMEALNKSIPDKTSTVAEKEKAVKVKNEILRLMQQKLAIANKEGDISLAQSLKDEIKAIEGERDTILFEIDAITAAKSIYNQDAKTTSTNLANNVSIFTQNNNV